MLDWQSFTGHSWAKGRALLDDGFTGKGRALGCDRPSCTTATLAALINEIKEELLKIEKVIEKLKNKLMK